MNHNIIHPDINKILFTNSDIYFDWTQELKYSIIQYISTHGIIPNRHTLDGGNIGIYVNDKHYSIDYSTMHIGYPCDVSKCSLCDLKPD